MNLRFLLGLALAPAIGACGSSVTDSASSGAGSTGAGGATSTSNAAGTGTTSTSSTTSSLTTSTSTGAGGGGDHGACKNDADCGGKPCVALTPGGYTVCIDVPAEATMCKRQMPPDQCCKSSDCVNGKKGACFDSTDLPACGGAQIDANLCIDDACATDADCNSGGTPGICAPAGAFSQPKRVCIVAYCKTDADCTQMGGGACKPVLNPCCSKPSPNALACVYPGGCAQDSDCGLDGAEHCAVENGIGVCKTGPEACPG